MVGAIALSGNLVKSQQIGEAELTLEQRKEELLNQYRSKPLVFLERYHVCALSSNVMCLVQTFVNCPETSSSVNAAVPVERATVTVSVFSKSKPSHSYYYYLISPQLLQSATHL